ncbi:MAG: hypothetical protein R3E76_00060 [Planctomycetota bacterium]
MANFKTRSTKLPILLGIPLLALLGVAAFLLFDPSEPEPPTPPNPGLNEPEFEPPLGNTEPDPLVVDPNTILRPEPRPGAPESVELADAILEEAWTAMRQIRARLELKYKYADYTLDRTWTIAGVMRRPEKLNGTYFGIEDFSVVFPKGDDPFAEITCLSRKGQKLPDGNLIMTLNLRNGECTEAGTIYARSAGGGVLLPDDHYRVLTNVLQRAAISHMIRHSKQITSKADTIEELTSIRYQRFSVQDFHLEDSGDSVKLSCRSIQGQPLEYPCEIAIDYDSRRIVVSEVPSREWMPLPTGRQDFEDSGDWYLRQMVEQVSQLIGQAGHSRQVTLKELSVNDWFFVSCNACPMDLTISVSAADPLVVTLEFKTSWGRPLPFKTVRFVGEPGKDRYGFEQD